MSNIFPSTSHFVQPNVVCPAPAVPAVPTFWSPGHRHLIRKLFVFTVFTISTKLSQNMTWVITVHNSRCWMIKLSLCFTCYDCSNQLASQLKHNCFFLIFLEILQLNQKFQKKGGKGFISTFVIFSYKPILRYHKLFVEQINGKFHFSMQNCKNKNKN